MACDITCPSAYLDDRNFKVATLTLLQTICANLDLEVTQLTDVEPLVFHDYLDTGVSTPFIRTIVTALDGTKTVVDTTLDGTTPYVTTGTVKFYGNDGKGPASDGYTITPSDALDLPQVVDWLMAVEPGDVKVTFVSGSTLTQPLDKGQYLWGKIKKVWATPDFGTSPATINGYIS